LLLEFLYEELLSVVEPLQVDEPLLGGEMLVTEELMLVDAMPVEEELLQDSMPYVAIDAEELVDDADASDEEASLSEDRPK
jgi:hypothetical protein